VIKLKDLLGEDWSQKYKNSIDCNNPKGFSQKAHCAGKEKNESTKSDIIKDLDKVKNDLLKKVDVLVAKKKKLYSDVDIETPMSADEKKLDKEIADLFSDINKLVLQKRSLKEEVLDEDCWTGYKQVGMKDKGGRQVPNCVPVSEDIDDDYDELDVEDEDEDDFINFLKGYTTEINEAEYQGREVKLGKPMQGDVKKFKVYVKNPKTGKVIKVNFGHGGTSAAAAGEETMRIRKSNPDRRKAFRARHNCDQPGPRTKARYWSCKKW
jgi:hypothetical protein